MQDVSLQPEYRLALDLTSKDRENSAPSPKARLDFARVTALAHSQWRLLLAGTFALLLSTGTTLIAPLWIGDLVDRITSSGGRSQLNQAVLALLVLFVVSGAAGAARMYWFTVAGERIVLRLRQKLFAALIAREVAFFDSRRTGELINRLSSDTTVLQNTVTVNVSMALRFGLQGLGAIGILLWTSWKLAAVMLAVVPVVALGAVAYGRRLRRLSRKVQDALASASEVAEESLSGIRTVRAFDREQVTVDRYSQAVEASYELARQRAWVGGLFTGFIGVLGYGAIAAVLWYGGVLLLEGAMSFGQLTSFLLYTFTVAFSIGALGGLWSDFARAAGASQRVFELIDEAPIDDGKGSVIATPKGHIVFDSVAFNYPTRPDLEVLGDVSFELKPGEVVALVGPSGAGKSTIAQLLSRLYDPISGGIYFDRQPYVNLDSHWLRQHVGVVSQEPMLFATSIAENIRFGQPKASDEAIKEAAKAANCAEFIDTFDQGYETLVGERGVQLSGGQKQRVAIARALLKDPTILVLDEATSALDAKAEQLVQEALERLMLVRTTLVIAHRLSTVRSADRVMVLDDGRLVEQGSHDQLVAQGGLYQRLVELQFR